MHAIVAHMKLPFFKIFSNLNIFAQIFKYFAPFCPFSEKPHACPYFLEETLNYANKLVECPFLELSRQINASEFFNSFLMSRVVKAPKVFKEFTTVNILI